MRQSEIVDVGPTTIRYSLPIAFAQMEILNPDEKRLLLDRYLTWVESDGVIVLSPDWSVDVPLWPQSDATDELVPEPLLHKLVAWQEIFNLNYKWSDKSQPEGWLSEGARIQWEEAAPVLVSELTVALTGNARLIVDLWPITPSSQNHELQKYRSARKAEGERWHEALDRAGIKLEWRSPFHDKSGQRIEWVPEN